MKNTSMACFKVMFSRRMAHSSGWSNWRLRIRSEIEVTLLGEPVQRNSLPTTRWTWVRGFLVEDKRLRLKLASGYQSKRNAMFPGKKTYVLISRDKSVEEYHGYIMSEMVIFCWQSFHMFLSWFLHQMSTAWLKCHLEKMIPTLCVPVLAFLCFSIFCLIYLS